MAEISKITKVEKTYYVDDGAKRGPLTMSRVRFHPRESQLVAQTADRRLALFDLTAEPTAKGKNGNSYVPGELVCPHEIGWVRSLDFHPKGESLATGGSDRTLRIWSWANGRPALEPQANIVAHAGWVESIAYSPDGKLLVTTGADAQVKVWGASDLKLLHTLTGHTKAVLDVLFTHNGERFITAGEDGEVRVWNSESFALETTITFGNTNDQFGQTPKHSGVHRLAISADDRWLGVAGGDAINVYDLATGDAVATERLGMEVAFHPQQNVIAIGESEVKLWHFEPGQFTKLELDKSGKISKPKGLPGKSLASIKRGEYSLGLQFSPDGKQVAFGKNDGHIELSELT